MFLSRRRPVVFPQWEHARLAGAIALAWGNDGHTRPPIAGEAFVRGVTLHDRGYAPFDTDPVGGVMPAERWIEIQLASAEPRGEPLVDIVVALHVRRLVGDNPRHAPAAARMDAWIAELLRATGLAPEEAAAVDRVTDLCDRVAFSFCFERPASGAVGGIRYEVDGEGSATLDPWPLAPPELQGLLLAYRAEAYPGTLDPVVVPYRVSRA